MENQRLAYSVAEAAEALGVSQWLMREACRLRQVHSFRVGRRILIPRDALQQLLTNPGEIGAAEDVGPAE
ncbi:MAG: helix-turn-helix domain-containing protein [Chloroflexi bacterium]|nr:helix-turn-helix domain-containing protein [Chloroflexota bacterium]MYD47039.1 helix-turn-helix domain-containing protein [Chloroflexota bacterium]MYE66862.1 helix-turn-helix domain-containing protein [Acidimicrobiia bacterium]